MVDRPITGLDPLSTITNTTTAFVVYDPDGATSVEENKRYEFSSLLADVNANLALTNGLTLISANDTTANFLSVKLVPGPSGLITLTEINDGGDETLEVDFIGTAAGEPYFAANSSNTFPAATGTNSFAYGDAANAPGNGAYQIGPGTNNNDNTLQYTDIPIAVEGEGIATRYITTDPVSTTQNGVILISDDPAIWFRSQATWQQQKLIKTANQDIGDGILNNFTVTHNFGTRRYSVDIVRTASPFDNVYPAFQRNVNDVFIDFGTFVPTTNQFRVLIQTIPE